jgi:hypothetical protein
MTRSDVLVATVKLRPIDHVAVSWVAAPAVKDATGGNSHIKIRTGAISMLAIPTNRAKI